MAVSKYNELFPYIIECLSDGNIHSLSDLTDYCAKSLKLTDSELSETITSGQNKLHNTVCRLIFMFILVDNILFLFRIRQTVF